MCDCVDIESVVCVMICCVCFLIHFFIMMSCVSYVCCVGVGGCGSYICLGVWSLVCVIGESVMSMRGVGVVGFVWGVGGWR